MKTLRRVRLECIDSKHNKFYEMTENGDGTFTARYGRIGTSGAVEPYPMSKWDDKFNEKKYKKNYKIVSDTSISEGLPSDDRDSLVEKLNTLLILLNTVIDDSPTTQEVWYKWKSGVEKTLKRLRTESVIDKTDLEFCNNIYSKIQPILVKLQNSD